MDIQNQKLQNVVNTTQRNSEISGNPVASRNRGRPLKVVENNDPSTKRQGRRMNDRVILPIH